MAAQEPPRSGRFVLLAACVGLSACLGAGGGAAGVLALAHLLASTPTTTSQPVQFDTGEDIRALKETVGELHVQLKSVGTSLGALRASLNGTTSATAGQLAKVAESIERMNHAQSEHIRAETAQTERVQAERIQAERRAASAAAPAVASAAVPPAATENTGPNVTGTIAPAGQAKPGPAVIEGWVVRRARDGAALVEGRYGTIEIELGDYLPGIGRVENIRRQDGRWVVVTPKGLILSAR